MSRTKKNTAKPINLYLPAELVVWATEYAQTKHGISLSKLIARRLAKLRNDAKRAA